MGGHNWNDTIILPYTQQVNMTELYCAHTSPRDMYKHETQVFGCQIRHSGLTQVSVSSGSVFSHTKRLTDTIFTPLNAILTMFHCKS